jgi:Uma2 family endonuclease
MVTATTHPEIIAAVLKRWQEILDDPRFNDPRQRIETDALGNVIMSPRPTGHHDQTCDWIRQVLKALPGNGAFGEHEVLTDKGVKITDVLWINPDHPWDKHSTKPLIPAPDICVEVRSPTNTIDSLVEKRDAYLRAGAKEVWISDSDRLYFFDSTGQIPASKLCPWCPDNIQKIQRRLERPLQQAIRRAFHSLIQPFSREPRTATQQPRFAQWPSHTQPARSSGASPPADGTSTAKG